MNDGSIKSDDGADPDAHGEGPLAGWLLISDVDDTLTGDGPALEQLVEAVAQRRPKLRVALNSSRPAASVDATLKKVFPAAFQPDAIITAMGTQIRVNGRWVDEWTKRFADWPRDAIARVVKSFGYAAHDDEYQTAHKASFAVPRGKAQDEVAAALRRDALPCRLIASGTDDLDILPPGGGKDHATLFLASHLGVAPERVVVAGDSANDLAMFNVACQAIAVGNARQELLEAMPTAHYRAKAAHAGGVLEGLEHYGVWRTFDSSPKQVAESTPEPTPEPTLKQAAESVIEQVIDP